MTHEHPTQRPEGVRLVRVNNTGEYDMRTLGPSLIRTAGMPNLSIELVFHQFGPARSWIFSSVVSCLTISATEASKKSRDISSGRTVVDLEGLCWTPVQELVQIAPEERDRGGEYISVLRGLSEKARNVV